MSNITTTIPTILKYVSQISSFPLRWYYTAPMLDQFLKLDVSSCGTGVDYYYPSQEGTCWLSAYNLSPFDFTIDRIKVDACIGGGSFSVENTMPILIQGMSDKRICVRGKSPMTPEAAHSAKESKQAWVDINAYIITSIRKFEIRRHIQDLKNFSVIA